MPGRARTTKTPTHCRVICLPLSRAAASLPEQLTCRPIVAGLRLIEGDGSRYVSIVSPPEGRLSTNVNIGRTPRRLLDVGDDQGVRPGVEDDLPPRRKELLDQRGHLRGPGIRKPVHPRLQGP